MKHTLLFIVGILVVCNSGTVFSSSLVFKHNGYAVLSIKSDGSIWLKDPPLYTESSIPVYSQNLKISHSVASRVWADDNNVYTSGGQAQLLPGGPSRSLVFSVALQPKTIIDDHAMYFTSLSPSLLSLTKADLYLENHVVEKDIVNNTHTDFCTYSDGRIDYGASEHKKFFLKDHLGSTRAVVNDEGTATEKIIYDAYGFMTTDVVAAAEIKAKQKFTGKEYDQEGMVAGVTNGLQLNYFGKRYYDGEIGLWTAVDPGHQFWDSYAYAGNGHNPISATDPDGARLIFDANVSTPFKAEFARSIQYLNKTGNSGVIAALEARPEIVIVKEGGSLGNTGFTNNYAYNQGKLSSVDNTIYWDAYSASKFNGGTQSPAMGILEESAHALGAIQDPSGYNKRLGTPDNVWGNAEEKRVANDIVNPAAIRAGENATSDYNSRKPYKVNHSDERK